MQPLPTFQDVFRKTPDAQGLMRRAMISGDTSKPVVGEEESPVLPAAQPATQAARPMSEGKPQTASADAREQAPGNGKLNIPETPEAALFDLSRPQQWSGEGSGGKRWFYSYNPGKGGDPTTATITVHGGPNNMAPVNIGPGKSEMWSAILSEAQSGKIGEWRAYGKPEKGKSSDEDKVDGMLNRAVSLIRGNKGSAPTEGEVSFKPSADSVREIPEPQVSPPAEGEVSFKPSADSVREIPEPQGTSPQVIQGIFRELADMYRTPVPDTDPIDRALGVSAPKDSRSLTGMVNEGARIVNDGIEGVKGAVAKGAGDAMNGVNEGARIVNDGIEGVKGAVAKGGTRAMGAIESGAQKLADIAEKSPFLPARIAVGQARSGQQTAQELADILESATGANIPIPKLIGDKSRSRWDDLSDVATDSVRRAASGLMHLSDNPFQIAAAGVKAAQKGDTTGASEALGRLKAMDTGEDPRVGDLIRMLEQNME